MNHELTIAWLYPDLMSTYGDRGNIMVLQKRCQWRGIATRVTPVTLETEAKELSHCDLIFMGGAQDRQQKIASDDFIRRKGPVIGEMVESGIPALFVCAAYQFVGHYYKPYQGDAIPGAGIFDLYTEHPGDQAKRLIGNVVAQLESDQFLSTSSYDQTIVGFENHGGRTYLGSKMKPLAKVLHGFGNNGEDGYEGALYKNSIGSYFHGPLLSKNPHIADWLIATALEMKYKNDLALAALDDRLEWQAHAFLLHR
ncbi:cobalamin biosynthesis protein CobQ [Candidatus Gottesmanbacteria bacterium]|nr:cobalamin biosynthesis protein CobQ [Candidatus Gottesmanbacteria bacterium]